MRKMALSGLLCAAMAVSGCATSTVVLRPPAEYLRPCVAPELLGSTNGALVEYANGQKQALRACNDDKRAIREWLAEADKKF